MTEEKEIQYEHCSKCGRSFEESDIKAHEAECVVMRIAIDRPFYVGKMIALGFWTVALGFLILLYVASRIVFQLVLS